MATIFGVLGMADRDTFEDTTAQRASYDLINQYAAQTQADLDAAFAVLVQSETDVHAERYFLPSGGMMQASANRTRPGAVKPINSYDVAYPIDDFRDQIAADFVATAYMTAAQLDAQVKGVAERYKNTKRYLILKALLNPTNDTFVDQKYGSLTIRRLANATSGSDTTVYPPVIGSSTEATEDHYIETGYASASISDTNNPFVTARNELEEHFGQGTIVSFINNAERAKVEALTNFAERIPMATTPADNNAVLAEQGLPSVPGRIIGAINDVLVSEWRWIPANYILTVMVDQPAPLKKRVDEPASLRGFKLVAEQQEFPLQESFWMAREGYGVANRLNGVVLELGTGGTYTVPSSFA
jgi:hypothetical protein